MRSTYRLGQTTPAGGASPVFMAGVVVFSGLLLGGLLLNYVVQPVSARRR